MNHTFDPRIKRALMAAVVVVLASLAPHVHSESSGTQAPDGVAWHHQMQARAMRDMARIMDEMASDMSRGEAGAAERARMRGRMVRMSEMMRLMADWEGRAAFGQKELKEPMLRMRREMDEMIREMEDGNRGHRSGR